MKHIERPDKKKHDFGTTRVDSARSHPEQSRVNSLTVDLALDSDEIWPDEVRPDGSGRVDSLHRSSGLSRP
jgi:hypothetical protein